MAGKITSFFKRIPSAKVKFFNDDLIEYLTELKMEQSLVNGRNLFDFQIVSEFDNL